MSIQPMLLTNNLCKSFGKYRAVDNINLAVKQGEIFGFLGPNGAGKTTTIKMLAGLLRPDSGSIMIHGHDLATRPRQCKQATGYIPDRPYLYEKLTGLEFLRFMASLYNLEAVQFDRNVTKFLELFDLADWRDQLIESYSHGMRQKLIITSVFMLEPPLIVVDEPMVGLDPKSARLVKELFRQHVRQGKAVFLSTHSLEIAEELCTRIAIIVQGTMRACGDLAELRKQARSKKGHLEDIFLELTGSHELQAVVQALRA